MGHQSKHHGSTSSRSSSSRKKSQGTGMLGTYLYDTSSVHEMQYQSASMTKDQRREEMRNQIDNFDQQFGTQTGQAAYQQPYAYSGTRR